MSKKNTRFPFSYDWNGQTIRLPKFGDWNFGVRRRLLAAGDDDEAAITIVLSGSADAENLAIIDQMHTRDLVKLINAWQEDAGITVGESESSGES